MKDPGYIPEHGWRDADGNDLEQDTRWDDISPGYYFPDPTLTEWAWSRPKHLKSPVRREDFNPTPRLTPSERTTPALPSAASPESPSAAGSLRRRRTPSPF